MVLTTRRLAAALLFVSAGIHACGAQDRAAPIPRADAAAPEGPADAASVDAAGDLSVQLDNGVVVTADCNVAPDYTVVHSSEASHAFLGYGVNVKLPGPADDLAKVVADMKALGVSWVKTDPALPYKGDGALTAPVGVSDDQMFAALHDTLVASWTPVVVPFYKALHAADIRIVSTMFGAPASYVHTVTLKDGSTEDRIDPDRIADFAQFYVAYFRVMNELGITADVAELQNEPNGQFVHWTAGEFAQLVTGIHDGLARNPGVIANVSTAGNCSPVKDAVAFTNAVADAGLLPSMKAITLHTYYLAKAPNNEGVASADDDDFATLFAAARSVNIPLMSTEYGGTDVKTKTTDPSLESVNPAEELKAALDVVRAGGSAALAWILYPNMHGQTLLKTWALIDENGPTDAYWPMKVLAPNIPSGASVLRVTSSDVPRAIDSPGYAAFRRGRSAVLALANPSPKRVTFAVDLEGAGAYVVDHARSFTKTGLLEKPTSLRRGACPLRVTLPGDTSGNDDGTGVVLSVTTDGE